MSGEKPKAYFTLDHANKHGERRVAFSRDDYWRLEAARLRLRQRPRPEDGFRRDHAAGLIPAGSDDRTDDDSN